MFSYTREHYIGCLPVIKFLASAFMAFILYRLATQSPLDYIKLFAAIAITVIVLFIGSPLSKSLYMHFPFLSAILPVLICGSIAVFLEVREQPVDYVTILTTLLTIVAFLVAVGPWNRRIFQHSPNMALLLFALFGVAEIVSLLIFSPTDYNRLVWITITFTLCLFLLLYIKYLSASTRRDI